jgi:hypothetical protein
MQIARSRIASVALALSTLWLAAPALLPPIGNVLVVDDDGSAPFTTIQSAVDAAIDGDVVLVRPGNYSGFSITDESLVVVGDLGAAILVHGPVHVVDIAASRSVVLANLSVTGAQSFDLELAVGLMLRNDAGSVRVESCTLVGWAGMWARGCADVSVVGCYLRGAFGILAAESSVVTVYGSVVRGADSGPTLCFNQVGRPGGDGGDVRDSFLFGGNSSFLGGRGGDIEGGAYLGCPIAGSGGAGIRAADAVVHLFDTATVGGQPGDGIYPGCGDCVLNGYVGADRAGAMFSDLVGHARTSSIPTPQFGGTTTTITLRGIPGDQAFVLISGRTSTAEFVPTWHGMLLVPRPRLNGDTRILVGGTIPASGQLGVPYALPPVPPGAPARTLFLQGLFRDPTGEFFLSGARSLTVLP